MSMQSPVRAVAIGLLAMLVVPVSLLALAYLANWRKEHTFTESNRELLGHPVDVVFLGDSITTLWTFPQPHPLFATHPGYVNRGISGDRAALMILRMPQDVFALKPKTVVFLGGINDLKSRLVPNALSFLSTAEVEASIRIVADLARAHGERLILCSLTPVDEGMAMSQLGIGLGRLRPKQVLTVNRWIENFAQKRGLTYVDLYSALEDGHGRMRSDLSDDGLHPNDAGLDRMAPLLERAIEARTLVGDSAGSTEETH